MVLDGVGVVVLIAVAVVVMVLWWWWWWLWWYSCWFGSSRSAIALLLYASNALSVKLGRDRTRVSTLVVSSIAAGAANADVEHSSARPCPTDFS